MCSRTPTTPCLDVFVKAMDQIHTNNELLKTGSRRCKQRSQRSTSLSCKMNDIQRLQCRITQISLGREQNTVLLGMFSLTLFVCLKTKRRIAINCMQPRTDRTKLLCWHCLHSLFFATCRAGPGGLPAQEVGCAHKTQGVPRVAGLRICRGRQQRPAGEK